jgi:hypothetical protein
MFELPALVEGADERLCRRWVVRGITGTVRNKPEADYLIN